MQIISFNWLMHNYVQTTNSDLWEWGRGETRDFFKSLKPCKNEICTNIMSFIEMYFENDLKSSDVRTVTSKYFNPRWRGEGEKRWSFFISQYRVNLSTNKLRNIPVQARSFMLELSSSFNCGKGIKNQKVRFTIIIFYKDFKFSILAGFGVTWLRPTFYGSSSYSFFKVEALLFSILILLFICAHWVFLLKR